MTTLPGAHPGTPPRKDTRVAPQTSTIPELLDRINNSLLTVSGNLAATEDAIHGPRPGASGEKQDHPDGMIGALNRMASLTDNLVARSYDIRSSLSDATQQAAVGMKRAG